MRAALASTAEHEGTWADEEFGLHLDSIWTPGGGNLQISWLYVFENSGGPGRTRICDLYRVKVEVVTQFPFSFIRLRAFVRSN